MARAAWKRPGSPIGKKGPRKANPSYKRRSRQPWSTADVRMLKQLAKGNTPTGVMSIKLQRPVAAIRSKAQREGEAACHIQSQRGAKPYLRNSEGANRILPIACMSGLRRELPAIEPYRRYSVPSSNASSTFPETPLH
jgi:hypothetical protein